MTSRPRVLICGAGFGGLWASRAFDGAPVQATLLDRNNYHTFFPLLYQVAAAEIGPTGIAYPVRSTLRRNRTVTFRMAAIERVDLDARRVSTTEGELEYDYLVLALGSEPNFFGVEGAEEHAFPLRWMDDAIPLRHHILQRLEGAANEPDPERRRAMLTFVIVGGGPTGVEYAGALSELLRGPVARDYPSIPSADIRVALVEASPRVLGSMPPRLSEYARKRLEMLDVELHLETTVASIARDRVTFGSGESLPTETVVWCAGVTGTPRASAWGLPTGRGGRVQLEPTLQLRDHPEVYVVGDLAYAEDEGGEPLPQVAQVAMQGGTHAAKSILRMAGGGEPKPFRYRDLGNLAVIGRNAAVADLGGRTFRGLPAWVLWLTIHIVQLIGFRNRLIVLVNWAWNYLSFGRAVRLILPGMSRRRLGAFLLAAAIGLGAPGPDAVHAQGAFAPPQTTSFRTEVGMDWPGDVDYPGERTGGEIGDLIKALRTFYWTPGFRTWTALIRPTAEVDSVCVEIAGQTCLFETEGILCRMDGGKGRECREGLTVGRRDLIRDFEEALGESDGDPWAVGQYVYFLEKIEEPRAARDALDYWCDSPGWWCHALSGYLHYSAGRGGEAETAFASMLEEMEPDHRCAWGDLTVLLDRPLRQDFESMDCPARETVAARIWWLGDPFWTVEGNDRRSEHYYRWLVNQLRAQLDRTGGAYMTQGGHWFTMRYGWFNGWRDITDRPPPGYGIPPSHRPLREHWYAFLPSPDLLEDPFSADPDAWAWAPDRNWARMADRAADEAAAAEDLQIYADSVTIPGSVVIDPRTDVRLFGEREAFTPRYAPVHRLGAQIATFVRGDSMRVVLVSEVVDTTLLADGRRRALLATSRSESDPPVVWLPRGADVGGDRFAFDLLLPEEPVLVSAEVFSERSGAARHRYAQHPVPAGAGGLRISDILLWEPVGGFLTPDPEAQASDIEEVIDRALPAERIPLGGSVELYWEVYGMQPGEPFSVSVRVVDDDPGLLRRLGGAVGLVDAEPHITTRFDDAVDDDGAELFSRILRLDASSLDPGDYRVEVRIEARPPAGAATAGADPSALLVTSRPFSVVTGPVGGAEARGG